MTFHRYSQLLSLLRELYTALYHCPPPCGPRTRARYGRLVRLIHEVQFRLQAAACDGYERMVA